MKIRKKKLAWTVVMGTHYFYEGSLKKYVRLTEPNGSVANRCPYVVKLHGQHLATLSA